MAPPLKDGLNRAAIRRLAGAVKGAWPAFDDARFVRAAWRGTSALELKERVAKVARVLAAALPDDDREALQIVAATADCWEAGDADDALASFAAWPLFDVVEERGLAEPALALEVLRDITHLFSAEFAIRAFLAQDLKQVLAAAQRWTEHPSEHVRRLASEGLRPRLPWGKQVRALLDDPAPILEVLEGLKDDPSLYVRRSVANNLNDIAKDHPDVVIDRCEAWLKGATAERRWIVERGTRTLVKRGHPRVWGLLGFTEAPQVEVGPITLSRRRLALGEALSFTCSVSSRAEEPQRLTVDYAVHYVKAKGTRAPKVFKLRVLDLAPGEEVSLSAKISFRPITTRRYYPGEHAVGLLVNGTPTEVEPFEVTS